MKTLSQKYNDLLIEAEKQIFLKVNKIGQDSNLTYKKSIKIVDGNYHFNLGNSGWLVQVTKDNLIDNYGYQYDFNVLSGEEFFALADYIKALKK
jgi:hypothetical protein